MVNMPNCAICLEDQQLFSAFRVRDKYVCHDCMRTLFERAVQNEASYPPKFDNVHLRPEDYVLALPSALRAAFREKKREYDTPIPKRIYCKCSAFVIRKIAQAVVAVCPACNKYKFCTACGETLGKEEHTCSTLATDKNEEDAYAGLEKGKDYQICPSVLCRRKVELIDGCNHMVCACGQEFCFICGDAADDGSDHWGRGREGCPRWNHPSASNATYLPPRFPQHGHAAQDAEIGEAVVMPPGPGLRGGRARRGDFWRPGGRADRRNAVVDVPEDEQMAHRMEVIRARLADLREQHQQLLVSPRDGRGEFHER